MEGMNTVKLSSGELYVLSALLGHDFIFGVEQTTLRLWGADIRKKVKAVINGLERKKYVRLELDGTTRIVPSLQRWIGCLCDPKQIMIISGHFSGDRNKTVYVLESDDVTCILKQTSDGKYTVSSETDFKMDKLLPKTLFGKKSAVQERLLLEEATFIQKKIHSFEQEEANDLIAKCIEKTSSQETVFHVLSGNSKYLNVQMYCKGDGSYDVFFNRLFTFTPKGAFAVSLDENDTLFIKSAALDEVKKELCAAWEGSKNS